MKTLWLLSIFAVVVVYLVSAFATIDRSSDEVQIVNAIESAAKGVEEKDLGKLFKPVSRSYKDNSGMTYEKARVLIAQAMSGDTKYSVDIRIGNVEFVSEMATVVVHPHIKEERTGKTVYNKQITFDFQQEQARHAWFLPVKKWRVVSSTDIGLTDYY